MAIVLNSTPAAYSSAHGDLIFTAYEATKAIDPVIYPNYKYVCDIYIGGVMAARQRAFPNPVNNRGVFNIGTVVRNYLATAFNPGAGLVAQEFGAGQFYIDVVCKFGEEYAYTTYTNLTVDSTRRYYNHYNDAIISDPTILDAYLDTFASNMPLQTGVLRNAAKVLIPFFAHAGTDISFTIHTDDGGVADQVETVTPTAPGNLLQLNVSPSVINALHTGMINENTNYYTITAAGVTYRFNLTCEKIYTPYTLHFLNQLGGFESCVFTKKSRKTYEVEKKSFTQLPYRIASDGTVNYSNSGGVVNDTATSYSSLFKQKMKLTTDVMNDNGYEWLKELQFSPFVYFEYGNFLIPVTVEGTTYEPKKFVNDKMSSVVVDISFGQQLNAQFR